LAVEVNNSAKVALLTFNVTAVFQHGVLNSVGKWRSWSEMVQLVHVLG